MELVAKGLTVERGERRVINALDLRVGPREALVVTGANGAGKSTLLRALAGLVRAAAGRVTLGADALPGDAVAYAGQLHFIGHQGGAKGALTAAENIAFWRGVLGAPDGASGDALDAFGLRPFAHLPAAYLSQGLRRRLALSRLVAVPRPLWLLDEPAAGLDAASRATLGRVIEAHRTGGGMVVMASHGELALDNARVLALGGA